MMPDSHDRSKTAVNSPLEWGRGKQPIQQEQVRRHTSTVNAIKILVVVSAISLLAMMTLWPMLREDDRFLQLGLSPVTIDEEEATPALIRPRLYGIDANGQPYTITADKAKQQENDEVLLDKINADITLNSGSWLSVVSNSGVYWQKKRELNLEEDVNLVLDSGYEFKTDVAFVDLKTREIQGEKPIKGQGPLGTLQSDRFLVESNGDEMIFLGNVHVVLYP